jgi:hypothetical protein
VIRCLVKLRVLLHDMHLHFFKQGRIRIGQAYLNLIRIVMVCIGSKRIVVPDIVTIEYDLFAIHDGIATTLYAEIDLC